MDWKTLHVRLQIKYLVIAGGSVVDPHHFDADPDSTYYPDADPDPDPSLQVKTQTLEKVLTQAHIPYILACNQQIDEDPDPVPDTAYHFDADLDADPGYQNDRDADPDTQH